MENPNSSLTAIQEANQQRRTARANAGIPPERFGASTSVSESLRINDSNVSLQDRLPQTNDRNSYARSLSGRSHRSMTSSRTNRSFSSVIQQSQIDVQTEEELNSLEEQLDIKDREIQTKELDVKNLIDIIEHMKEDLSKIPIEEGESIRQLQEQISEQSKALTFMQNEVQKDRITFKFETKSIARKKAQIRRKADLQKQIVQEEEKENDDNLSQRLSDSDEEEDAQQLQLQQQQVHLHAKLAEQKMRAAAVLQQQKEASDRMLNDDELLIRLRRLHEPVINPDAGGHIFTPPCNLVEPKTPEILPTPISQSSDIITNQFVQALTKTFDKFTNNSSTTDKFLARQVHGKDLPQFWGKPEEWSTFITAFDNSTLGCHYNNQDNLPRLQKCLKGEALKTVQCLLARSENVPAIIAKLKMRFGRPEHIVHMLICKAKEVPPFREDRLDLLIDFGLAVDNLVETIKALNCHEHLTSPQLLEEFYKKLPITHRTKWMEWLTSDPTRKENIENFAQWMAIQTEIACKICPPKWKDDNLQKKFEGRPKRKEERVWAAAESSTTNKVARFNPRDQKCLFCDKKGHRVLQCSTFEKEDIDAKWKWVKSNKHCFACLRYGHSAKECRSKKECGKDGCRITHHSLLHQHQQSAHVKQNENIEEMTISHAVKSKQLVDRNHTNLMVLPVILKGPKGEMTTLAFLDPGASVTVIDEDVAVSLGLEGPRKPFAHSGLHPTITEVNSRSVSLQIFNTSKTKSFNLQNVRTIAGVSLPRQAVQTKMLTKWKHLQGLGIESYDHGQPTILIGQDHLHLCNTKELIVGPPNAPGAGRTELGWVLIGQVNESTRTDFSYSIQEQREDDLHQLVKRHFTTEDFGVKVTIENQRSQEDIRGQKIMDSTIKKLDEGWEIGLLWKSDNIELPTTKDVAKNRLLQMERRMDRDPIFAKQYIAKIEEYQQKGFARLLSTEEAETEGLRTYYLPHFMSKNPKKPKKLRFVFDAAAKVKGVSLNDALLKGPDKLTNLPTILFKFRQRAIAITADIKDMFHRVKVRNEDSSSQRFLWRGLERVREPQVYEMGVLIFGASCSPACAQEVKNLNAEKFKEDYPHSANAIINNHYVDDYLDSLDTTNEAIKRFREVKLIHQHGGFNICNWITNSKEVLDEIPEELRAPGGKSLDLEGDLERVLGMFWRPESDNFTFSKTFLKANEEIISGTRLPTKRELLSLVMSIYDPLGCLSLFSVKARIILQETWKTEIGWDDEIPKSLQGKWEHWNEELKRIDDFKLPRCYSPELSTADKVQLHIFVDASEQAFGGVAYFRIQKKESISVAFVSAKAKVAPTKHLTIPRLELQAAVLGARLATFIKEAHDIRIDETVFWSDSSTVLSWIKADGNRFKQFVASRIGEIHEATNVDDWRWVPTKENVADELTRDNQPSNWSHESRWINGPDFLRMSEEIWPKAPASIKQCSEDVELKKEHLCIAIERKPTLDITRFSSWSKLIRTMGYVFRFIAHCQLKKQDRSSIRELIPSELARAEIYWWKTCQQQSFPDELYNLRQKIPVPKTSRLYNLNVILDHHSVMRLDGRINNAAVSEHTKHPVVLDPKHSYTKLLILHYHTQGGHFGREKIVNELRQRFYILNIRTAVKTSWNDCQKCKNDRSQPLVPLMGQLPDIRLQSHVSPFKNTGLDYFGPMNVKVGRKTEKRWGALFTCLSTRAVHLELAASLNTDSCLMAIRRFVSRRGCPTDIFSDNGTNFVGANNELKKSLSEISQDQMTAECTTRGIQWHFIPPSSPHMGGSWERMVKSIKVALKAVLNESTPREEVLQTLLAEAEHSVNCHPLTHVSVDPNDPEALTPNHFLIGRSSNIAPPGNFQKDDLISRKQWRHAQHLANQFWKRWIQEYLPSLLRRGKWFQQQKPIEIGDIVLVVDNQLTRNLWPLGLVVQLYPGKDGLIRVVDVKTITGTYRRPVAKLCKLDVKKDEIDEKPSNQATETTQPLMRH